MGADPVEVDTPCIYDVGEDARYDLVARMPSGAEGQVWRARQRGELGTVLDVVVKVLDPSGYLGVGADPAEILRRWRGHARQLRNLRHPGIAPVQVAFLAADEPDAARCPPDVRGRPVFVTAFVPGVPLHRWHGPPSIAERLLTLHSCAEGLEVLHRDARHAHADVKPSNVIIASGGTAPSVLIDFGLLRSFEQLRSGRTGPVGTIGYVAPEVLEGGEYSATTDRYAFAGVIFFVVSGANPPSTGDVKAQAYRMLIDSGAGRALAVLVSGALARRPADRHDLTSPELLNRAIAIITARSGALTAQSTSEPETERIDPRRRTSDADTRGLRESPTQVQLTAETSSPRTRQMTPRQVDEVGMRSVASMLVVSLVVFVLVIGVVVIVNSVSR